MKKPFVIFNKTTGRFKQDWFEFPEQANQFIAKRYNNSNRFVIVDKRRR